jgi:hypothetical protein
MYTFVDFTSQIVGPRESLVPQTKGSHTPIWCAGLAVTLKIDYYYYYFSLFHLVLDVSAFLFFPSFTGF